MIKKHNQRSAFTISFFFGLSLFVLSLIAYYLFNQIFYQADTIPDEGDESSEEEIIILESSDGYILSRAPNWAPDNHGTGDSFYKKIFDIPESISSEYSEGITKIFNVKPVVIHNSFEVTPDYELEVILNLHNDTNPTSKIFSTDDKLTITSEVKNLSSKSIGDFRTNFHIFTKNDDVQIDRLFRDFLFRSISTDNTKTKTTEWTVPEDIETDDIYLDLLIYYGDEPVCGPYLPKVFKLSNTTPICLERCGDNICQNSENDQNICLENATTCPEDCTTAEENFCNGQTVQDYFTRSNPITYLDTSTNPAEEKTFIDYCKEDEKTLVEGLCSGDTFETEDYICPNECQEGRCVQSNPGTSYASPGITGIDVYTYEESTDPIIDDGDDGDDEDEINFDPVITENPELVNKDNSVSGSDVFKNPTQSVSVAGIQSGPGFVVTIIIVIVVSSVLIYFIIKKEN